eukprot:982931-Amorphochlora_amoeboformis.AAC.1
MVMPMVMPVVWTLALVMDDGDVWSCEHGHIETKTQLLCSIVTLVWFNSDRRTGAPKRKRVLAHDGEVIRHIR